MRALRPGCRRQQGFILLLVLGVLVVLSLLASAIAITVNQVRQDRIRDERRLQAELDMRSTQATLLYLLGTQRITYGGLTVDNQIRLTAAEQSLKAQGENINSNMPVGNELSMDGSLYHGLGRTLFSLRADSGKLSINWSNPVALNAFLDSLHVPPEKHAALFAKLLDYQDPDSDKRLGGAEADDYMKEGRAPPPNRTLMTPMELRRIPGWDKALESVSDKKLIAMVTVNRWAQVCVNTASSSILAFLPGVTPAMAERVVMLRQAQAFYQMSTVYDLLPSLPQDNDLVSLFPGGSGTLALWQGADLGGRVVHWTLTPFDDGGRPWRISYEFRLSAHPGVGSATVRKAQTTLLSHPSASNPR